MAAIPIEIRMAQLSFKSLPWRPQRIAAASPAAGLSLLLAESVTAILLPHLRGALLSYAVRDRARVLAAYAIGCSILTDLLSQEIAVAGWKDAGIEAMKRLVAACELDEVLGDTAALDAVSAAAWLKLGFEASTTYLEVCQTFGAAIGEVRENRMSAKGSITARAAMARLEGMVMNVDAFTDVAV